MKETRHTLTGILLENQQPLSNYLAGPAISDLQMEYPANFDKPLIAWKQIRSNVKLFYLAYREKGKPIKQRGQRVNVRTDYKMLPVKYTHAVESLQACKEYIFYLHVYDKSNCGIPMQYKLTHISPGGM